MEEEEVSVCVTDDEDELDTAGLGEGDGDTVSETVNDSEPLCDTVGAELRELVSEFVSDRLCDAVVVTESVGVTETVDDTVG